MHSFNYSCAFLLFTVILSDYYDLPFNDILDWKKFAVILKEKDVYQLKSILKSITHEEFVALHKGVAEVCFYIIVYIITPKSVISPSKTDRSQIEDKHNSEFKS